MLTQFDFLNHYFLGVSSLFAIVNPFSSVPLFLSLTAGMSSGERRNQALRAAFYAAIIMVVTLFLGGAILAFFSISIAALRVAGGLIVAVLGFRMLFPDPAPAPIQVGESDRELRRDYALIPLALPSLAGAGTIALVMTYSTSLAELPTHLAKAEGYAIALAAIATVACLAALILRASTGIARRLGGNGLEALTRIMGLLMVCIGIQFIGNGVKEFFNL
jgi:multiple antibiotic resistance protein